MKKTLKRFMALLLVLALVGCGSGSKKDSSAGLKDGNYKASKDGQNGPIEIELIVKNGEIEKAELVSESETPGLGNVAIEKILNQFNENKDMNIDMIGGATVSSTAVVEALTEALKEAGASDDFFVKDENKEAKKEELEDTYDFDVVVIGAGGAGLSAAIEAANTGAKVAVLEKTPAAGGNTLVSGGGLNVPGSRQQKGLDIEDSVEQFYEDTMNGGDNKSDSKLVKIMAENALAAADWLMDDIGVKFMDDRVQQFGGHSTPRALIPEGNKGVALISKLLEKAEEKDVKVFYEAKAEEIKMTDGKASGVVVKNNDKDVVFNASKGVIVASGGFASDVEMRKKYNDHYDERFKSTATEASTGDGIKMAEAVGAGLRDLDFIQVYPTCNPITGVIYYVVNARFAGAILVYHKGERFVNEMGRRDEISNAILDQEGSYAYLVWGQEVESVGHMTEVHEKEYEKWLKDDLIYSTESLEDAAKHYNIDEKSFMNTIDSFNKAVEEGKDEAFNKGGNMVAIKEGNFYIQKVVPSTHHTMGGITINEDAQVLDAKGEIIPNLYAAGEVVGGIHGTNRLGGNAITDIVVFGRIAGQNIVK